MKLTIHTASTVIHINTELACARELFSNWQDKHMVVVRNDKTTQCIPTASIEYITIHEALTSAELFAPTDDSTDAHSTDPTD